MRNTQRSQNGWRRLFSPFHVGLQSLLAILFMFSTELDRRYDLWIGMVLALGMPTVLVALVWIGGLLRSLAHQQWRRLAAVALAPLVVWPLMTVSIWSGFDADWVRFHCNKPDYQKTVRTLGATPPVFHSWDWGSTGGLLTISDFYSLVYDESDRVMRRNGEESSGGHTSVRSFGDHFYLVTRSDGG